MRVGRRFNDGLAGGGAGDVVGVFFQPEHSGQFSNEDDQRQEKKGFEPEFFHERAANKKRQRVRCRPADIVSADHARQAPGIFTFAHERLDRWPQET